MYTIIVIALLASIVVYAIAKKTAKPEPIATPEITEQEVHADLHSHVEPVVEVSLVVETPVVADETPSVIAAAKPKKKKKPSTKKMSAKKKDA